MRPDRLAHRPVFLEDGGGFGAQEREEVRRRRRRDSRRRTRTCAPSAHGEVDRRGTRRREHGGVRLESRAEQRRRPRARTARSEATRPIAAATPMAGAPRTASVEIASRTWSTVRRSSSTNAAGRQALVDDAERPPVGRPLNGADGFHAHEVNADAGYSTRCGMRGRNADAGKGDRGMRERAMRDAGGLRLRGEGAWAA